MLATMLDDSASQGCWWKLRGQVQPSLCLTSPHATQWSMWSTHCCCSRSVRSPVSTVIVSFEIATACLHFTSVQVYHLFLHSRQTAPTDEANLHAVLTYVAGTCSRQETSASSRRTRMSCPAFLEVSTCMPFLGEHALVL